MTGDSEDHITNAWHYILDAPKRGPAAIRPLAVITDNLTLLLTKIMQGTRAGKLTKAAQFVRRAIVPSVQEGKAICAIFATGPHVNHTVLAHKQRQEYRKRIYHLLRYTEVSFSSSIITLVLLIQQCRLS